MNKYAKLLTALSFGFATTIATATPPEFFITHNNTDAHSNVYIAGIIPSQHITNAHSQRKVSWIVVKADCTGRTTSGQCWAMVKMRIDTSTPVNLGVITIDMNTGDITPTHITANGYTLTVNGPGETTLTQ